MNTTCAEVQKGGQVPLLTTAQIDGLKRLGERSLGLWVDIEKLARRVHGAAERDLRVEFHHLLLAVVNFKAERVVVPPPLLLDGPTSDVKERDHFLIPLDARSHICLSMEDPESWQAFANAVPGFGPPRTTTLLAALWPERHAIMDWRALSAAYARVGTTEGWDKTPAKDGSLSASVQTDWPNYDWYRKVVLEEAAAHAQPPVDVERSLYALAKRVRPVPGRPWEEYAQQISCALP